MRSATPVCFQPVVDESGNPLGVAGGEGGDVGAGDPGLPAGAGAPGEEPGPALLVVGDARAAIDLELAGGQRAE